MTNKSGVGARIRECRKQRGVSQDSLAKALGYTDRSTIAKLESGKNAVQAEQLPTIANFLGVSEAYLRDSLADALIALGVEIAQTPAGVRLTDCVSSRTVSYTNEEWFVLQNKDDFRTVWAALMGGEKEETPAPIEDKRSDIQSIFAQLTPDNRAKLLELANFYLNSQHKSGET